MRRLEKAAGENGTAVCTAAAALNFPPIVGAFVGHWNAAFGCIPEFDMEIDSDNTTALTVGEVVGGTPEAATISDDDIDTVDFANNELDVTGHAYQTGDGPLQLTTTDTLPAGLTLLTDYYVIVLNSGTIQLALSLEDAFDGVVVAFTDGGTGTHTIVDTANTERIKWRSHGLVGQAASGAISLTASKGKTERFRHRSRVLVYGLVAEVDVGNISAKVYPALEI